MIHAFRFAITALSVFCALLSLGPLNAEVVATGFSPIIAAHSGKCLDATKAQTSSGSAITQYSCHGGDNQQWTVEAFSPGFRLISKDTSLCMVMSGGKLVQSTCTGSANELWLFNSAGAGFQIASQGTGLCLTVDSASTSDLASLIQSTCLTGQSNQQWIFTGQLTTASTQNAVIARHSGQCLMVNGGSTAIGTAVMQFPCGGATHEQWSLKPVGSDYQLIARHSAQCLSVIGGATTAGATLVQAPCQVAPTQLWTPKPISGGYQFVAKHSALCLTIPAGSMTAATTATQEICNSSLNQSWALSNPTPRSSWTGKLPMPIVAASAANLPNGKILTWASDGEFAFSGDTGPAPSQTYTAIFDPTTNASTEALISATGANMFCTGTSLLSDGTVLINGGSSSPKTSLYNPITDSWTAGAFMNIARGYQANTTLADGSVLTLGGSWSGPATNKIGEVWTSGVWGLRTGITVDRILYNDPGGIYRSDNHAWLFTTSGGKVFHAGPSKQMNWITTSGVGSIIDAGLRGDDADSVNGKAVMFDKGKILKTGGAPAYSNVMANSNSYVLDINSGVATRKIAPMAYARVFANGVVLPNGQVAVVGGQTFAGPFSDGDSVLAPELWDPVREVFTRLSPQMSPRVYHSVALLLPDGRVFSAGGGLCGPCATNHPDAEILSPPYLFNADGTPAIRPVITSAQTEITNSGTLSLTTDSPVSSFAIIRLSAATHSINNDERRIPLAIQSTPAPNSYVLSIPQDTGVALPGYYMLFAMNAAGTPSIAKTVHLGGSIPLPQGTNLALGKAATQSSNYMATTTAALAVDGNTNGDLNLGSVSHTGLDFQPFWQVDLGASANLKEIAVWNRTDNFASRLANFHVLVSDQPFAGNTLAQVQAQAGITDLRFAGAADSVSRFLINRPGRYVRVQLEGADYLHLAEVEVFGTAPQNSAPTVSITAPTTGASFVAPASFTITATAADVDNNLARVEFYNGATLLGFNTIGPYNFNWTNVAAGNYTLTVKAIDSAGLIASASVNVTVASPLPQGTNLALGKTAIQSSNYTAATIASLVVDGNTNGNYYSGSVSHTGLDLQPFWQVDLGSSGNFS